MTTSAAPQSSTGTSSTGTSSTGASSTGASSTEAATANASFVGYEFTKTRAPKALENIYVEAYRGFGWMFDSSEVRPPIRPLPLLPAIHSKSVSLTLKRDRRLRGGVETQELQRRAQASLGTIARLERSKHRAATVAAMLLGLGGAALLALSLFAMTPTMGVLSIVLGALGLTAWVAGAIAYFALLSRRTAIVTPLIDHELDTIAEAAEQASRLAA